MRRSVATIHSAQGRDSSSSQKDRKSNAFSVLMPTPTGGQAQATQHGRGPIRTCAGRLKRSLPLASTVASANSDAIGQVTADPQKRAFPRRRLWNTSTASYPRAHGDTLISDRLGELLSAQCRESYPCHLWTPYQGRFLGSGRSQGRVSCFARLCSGSGPDPNGTYLSASAEQSSFWRRPESSTSGQ